MSSVSSAQPTAQSAATLLPQFAHAYGVDFSGARLAGRTTWVARLAIGADGRAPQLVALDRLDRLAGAAERGPALAHLVAMVRASADALWAFDCPFGLPVELLPARAGWAAQRRLVAEWGDDAYGLGLECVRRARALGGPMHVRRLTDGEARAPFDPYHYRELGYRPRAPRRQGGARPAVPELVPLGSNRAASLGTAKSGSCATSARPCCSTRRSPGG